MLQTKSKSLIIIGSVLVIGIILGGLSARFFIDNRIKNFERMRHPEGFARVFERMLDLSDEQAEMVHQVLEVHHERFLALSKEHMEQIKMETTYVAGLPIEFGGSGDPSPFTALGTFEGIKASVKYRLKKRIQCFC